MKRTIKRSSSTFLWTWVLLLLVSSTFLPVKAQQSDGCRANAAEITLGELRQLGEGYAHHLAVSPDGTKVAVAFTTSVVLFNAETLDAIARLQSESVQQPWKVAWSPDSASLAVTYYLNDTVVWDVNQKESVLSIPTFAQRDMAWSPQYQFLATVDTEGAVSLWNVNDGSLFKAYSSELGMQTLSWSADGNSLALGSALEADSRNIHLYTWDVYAEASPDLFATGSVPGRHPNMGIHAVRWSPNGLHLAVLYEGFPSFELWEVATAQVIEVSQIDYNRVFDIHWSADSRGIVIVGDSGENHTLQVRSTDSSGTMVLQEQTGVVLTDWSPDGTRLYTVGGIGNVSSVPNDVALRLWDLNSGDELASVETYWGRVHTMPIQWTHDSSRISVFYYLEGTLTLSTRVWNITTGEVERDFQWRNNDHILAAAWSPDLSRLAYAAFTRPATDPSGTLVIRDFVDGNTSPIEVTVDGTGNRLYWSPDAGEIALVGSSRIRIWDSHTGALLNSLSTHGRIPDSRIAWTANGLRWIAIDDEGQLHVWQADRDRPFFSLNTQFSSDRAAILPSGDKLFADNYLWSIGDQQEAPEVVHLPESIDSWSPDERCVVTVSYDISPDLRLILQAYIIIWGVPQGEKVAQSAGFGPFSLTNLSWSPTSSMLAIGSEDGLIRIVTFR